jgi:large subunit ribosomal protein L13
MEIIYNLDVTFPKKENHKPKWFFIDANGKTLGRLATEASNILRGKTSSFFTPHVDQGNYLVIINADKICVTGKKEQQKLYYRNSQRPGSLKVENFKELKKRIPSRIIEKAIWGMLPKNVLGRNYYRRLYIYSKNIFIDNMEDNQDYNNFNFDKNWVKIFLK